MKVSKNFDLCELSLALRLFAKSRDWEKFHSPKNLAMALSVEVSELVEHFQWLPEQQSFDLSADKLKLVENEVADVFIYLIRIADILDIDLQQAVNTKMLINEKKYPIEKVFGSSEKYNEYD